MNKLFFATSDSEQTIYFTIFPEKSFLTKQTIAQMAGPLCIPYVSGALQYKILYLPLPDTNQQNLLILQCLIDLVLCGASFHIWSRRVNISSLQHNGKLKFSF